MSTKPHELLTSNDLLRARAQHVENVNLLLRHRPNWKGADIERGENTIANVVQQITEIDEELQMARRHRGGAA